MLPFHRTTEKAELGKDTQGSSSPSPGPAQNPKSHTMTPRALSKCSLELWKLWFCDPSRGVCSSTRPPSRGKYFSTFQPQPPLTQVQAIPSRPVTRHHEEISVCLSFFPHQEAVFEAHGKAAGIKVIQQHRRHWEDPCAHPGQHQTPPLALGTPAGAVRGSPAPAELQWESHMAVLYRNVRRRQLGAASRP